jgi:multidrug efflux pump subunit AcrA (membrane-fusion protein)
MQKRLLTRAAPIAVLLLTSACKEKEEKEVEAPAPVQVTAVTQDTVRRIVAGDGVLFPQDQASVTPKIQAPVQKFYVNRGDHVKAGQLLATLENRDLTAQAAESKGAVDQAESNLRTTRGASVPEALVKARTDVDADRQAAEAAKKVMDSREQLFQQGALAQRQVDEARVAYVQANSQLLSAQEHLRALEAVAKDEQIKTATAQVDSAKSHMQSLEAQVIYSRIVSPISGVIADRPLYAGEMAVPGTPLATVIDISNVVARVNIPQSQSNQVKLGQTATLTQTDSTEELAGKVTVVSPASDANSTTVQVWIKIPNPGERLKPGSSVHAKIVTELFKAATVLPITAILPGEEGGSAALVIVNAVAHKRQLQLGVREGDKVQVLNGVRPGEEVVTVGGMGVDDKGKVKVIDTSVKEADDEDNADEADKGGKDDKKDQKKDQKKDEAKPKAK